MAVSNFGDFDTTETVVIPFNTFDSNDPSASVTATNLANTDVHIHKDGGLIQRSSSAGVAVDIDVDAVAGCHWVTINLSDNTDAGFYANGSQYSVRIEGVTVDAATVNPWIGAFTIGRMLRPTTAGRTLDILATGEASANVTHYNGDSHLNTVVGVPDVNMKYVHDDGTAASNAEAFFDGTGYAGTNNVIPTVSTLTGHTAQTGDVYGLANGATGFAAIAAFLDTEIAAILADTADMQPRVAAIEVDTSTTLQAELDAIQAAVITNAAGVDIAADIIAMKAETALIVADTNELQTDNVPGLIATLDAVVDTVKADTAATLVDTAEIGAAGAGLTALASAADLAALNDISVADILTTQMTESYAANGVAPTLAQAQFAIHQMLMQFGIAGTNITVRQLDNATTAFIVTLDDATSPTDAKRV